MSLAGGIGAALNGVMRGYDMAQARDDRDRRDKRLDRMIEMYGERHQRDVGIGGFNPSAAAGPGARPHSGTLDDMLYDTEGTGWNTLFNNSEGSQFKGVNVSDMTLDELGEFSSPSGPYGQYVKGHAGRVATPMGKYQIVGTTLRGLAEEMGLPGDTKFTPEVQSAMKERLVQRRLAQANTPEGRRAAFRSEWEGLNRIDDASLDRAIAEYENPTRRAPIGAARGT